MKLTFIEKKEEAKNVETFVFKPEEKVDWQPGQYMHYLLDLPKADDKGPERWFTISYPPYTGLITITTRLDNEPFSAFKQYLMDLKPGDQIESDGPKGKFLLREDAARHILIAGGIFYLSGPKGMVESYEHLLPEMGVSPDNIVTDYFPGYN
jgi:ferredoxin-NADP reductase